MNLIRNLRYSIETLCSMHMIRLVPLIALAGVILTKSWERDNFFDAYVEVFNWDMILIGPLTAMLLVLLGYVDNVKVGTVLLHIGGRTKLFFNLLGVNMFFSFMISVWLNLILVFIGKVVFYSAFDVSELSILFRTGFGLWMLLFILGLVFLIVQWMTFRIAGVVIVLGVVGLEAAGELYFGNQFFWKYAFPLETKLYLSWGDFAIGMLWLLLFAIVLFCILFVVLQKKDFMVRQEEMQE